MQDNPTKPILTGLVAGIFIWAMLGCAIAVFGG
jgi:hypothetical protein